MVIRPRYRKVLGDLWINKIRTILVVLSIAAGVCAIGVILGSRETLLHDLNSSYLATNPANATLTTDPFQEEDLLPQLTNIMGVQAVTGGRSVHVRIQDGITNNSHDIQLFAIPDYENIEVNKIEAEEGTWPPTERQLMIERASLNYIGVEIGDMVHIETNDGLERELSIAGTVHDLRWADAAIEGQAFGYVTMDTLEWMGELRTLNEVYIVLDKPITDPVTVRRLVNEVRDKVERSGFKVYAVSITPPGEHPAEQLIRPILLVLAVIGFLALGLSGFLITNIMSALVTQQINQIGIMKAIGARTHQIMSVYLIFVLTLSFLSLIIAVPLGIIGARAFAQFTAKLVNFDVVSFHIPRPVLILEVVTGLVIPLLAALYPVYVGSRLTIRDAISDYGLVSSQTNINLIDQLIKRVRGGSRPFSLSLRNTFRRKRRLLLTLLTLTSSGAMFIAVLGVRTSINHTLESAFNYLQYDIQIMFRQPYRTTRVEQTAYKVSGVTKLESWNSTIARRPRPDGFDSENIFVFAPPADTELFRPPVISGRWLQPEDKNAVVVNTEFLQKETDLSLDDNIVLKIGGEETTWRIVGIVQLVGGAGNTAFVNYPYFTRSIGDVDHASILYLSTEQHTPDEQKKIAQVLAEQFQHTGMSINTIQTSHELRTNVQALFDVIIIFLFMMSLILTIVGGMGLMGTVSLNVIERTREIGVMRVLGATSIKIQWIVIGESLFIGTISWLFASLMAMPLSKFLGNAIGSILLGSPLVYAHPFAAMFIWLIIVLILSVLASLWPAHKATRMSVRAALEYE